MAVFSQFSLQKSIFQLLSGDAALAAMVSGIYDRPVQGGVFPYIVFGAWEGRDRSTKTSQGMEFSVMLHIWSREGGHKQAASIMERLYAVLQDAVLAVEGQDLISMRFMGSNITLEDDGSTYRGAMKLRAVLQAQ
jgi:hypothetical protein